MIRALTRADVPALERLGEACGIAWNASHLEQLLVSDPGYAQVVDSEGQLIAGLTAYLWPHEAELLDIAVEPGHRRQGQGALLLDALLVAARSRGCARVVCEVAADNPGAQALYGSRGFVLVSMRPGYYVRGPLRCDAHVLSLTLRRP